MVRSRIMALLALGSVCGCAWLRSVDANTRLATRVAREFGARQARIYVVQDRDLVIQLFLARMDTSASAEDHLAHQVAVFLRDRDSVYDTMDDIEVVLYRQDWLYAHFETASRFSRDSLGPRQDTASIIRED